MNHTKYFLIAPLFSFSTCISMKMKELPPQSTQQQAIRWYDINMSKYQAVDVVPEGNVEGSIAVLIVQKTTPSFMETKGTIWDPDGYPVNPNGNWERKAFKAIKYLTSLYNLCACYTSKNGDVLKTEYYRIRSNQEKEQLSTKLQERLSH